MITTSSLIKFEAFRAFLSTLQPKDGSREIWLKAGHNRFFVGDYHESGHFGIWETEGEGTNRRRTKYHSNGYEFLRALSESEECKGGIFYIPSQPQGFPITECITSTDDIGVERDYGSTDEQLALYDEFESVTELAFSCKLTSGGKSIHAHIKLDQHHPVDVASYCRRLAAIALLADPIPVRLHQPMRIPGFFRREKGREQSLLQVGSDRYTPDELIAGLQKWFDYKGWELPSRITEEWWLEFQRILASKTLSEAEKAEAVSQLLTEGVETFGARKVEERAEANRRAGERSRRFNETGKTDLSGLINEAENRIGATIFTNRTDLNWKWDRSRQKARGCCPWHKSDSGTAGWIKPLQHGWGFACGACTDNRFISAFTFWWWGKKGLNAPYPQGKEFIQAAEEFLALAGMELPKDYQSVEERERQRRNSGQIAFDRDPARDEEREAIARLKYLAEPDPIAYAETVSQQNQQVEIEQAQRNEAGINGVIAWVRNQPKNSVQPWGFAPLPAVPGSDVIQVGSHAEGHYRADEAGARLIVNLSATGSRKSTFYSRTTPEFFGTDRVFAVLPDALNPTVDSLLEWAHLEGRHLGNVEDAKGKLRRAKPETPASIKVTPANCDKAAAIEQMSDRNPVNPAYKLACLNCIHNWRCGKEQGDGFGARFQSSVTLKQPRVRMSYGRLHGQGEEANLLSKATLILDESSSNVRKTETIKVTQQDIKDTYFQIDRSGDPALQQFKPLLTYLLTDAWKAGDRHYGTGKAKLIPLLQEIIPENIDWAALERLEDEDEELKAFGFKPDVEPLSDAEYRRLKKLQDLKWLAPDQQRDFDQLQSLTKRTKGQHQRLLTYRKYGLTPQLERERDELQKRYDGSKREKLSASEMMAKAAFLPKRWLRDFLLVVTDPTYGYAHWGSEGVTVTLPNGQHLAAIQRAQKVVLSDASELRSKSELSKKYGIPEDKIFIFEVEQPKGAEVETVQITGLGRLGKNRGEGLEKCRQALVAKLKELDPTHATFDWKELSGKRSPDADGVLFRDTVGSNDYKHCQSISTTIPRPNINALLAEYCVLNETTVDEKDEGFQQFYKKHIAEALKQTRGRLREQLRSGEKLIFYIMGDDDIPIEGDRTVAAADICPDAARKGEKSIRTIVDAAKGLLQQGQELTQSAVARATKILGLNDGKGYTQQYISKLWGRILDLLQLFLGKHYKKSCSPAPLDKGKVEALVPVIEEIANTGPPESLDDVILWLSLDEWAIAFQVLSDSTKKMLIKCWVSLLPVGWVEAIA